MSKKSSSVVRVPTGLKESIEDFLKTESANKLGFRFVSDVVTVAVREYLINLEKEGVL